MKAKYVKTRVAVGHGAKPCSSKHSKAGAGCKMAKHVPCRTQ